MSCSSEEATTLVPPLRTEGSQAQNKIHMLILQLRLLRLRQKMRRLDHILDLSPVQTLGGDVVQLVLREPTVLAQELSPDLAPGSCVQLRIAQRYMDARFKRRVNMVSAVGSEEQNALQPNGQLLPTFLKVYPPRSTPAYARR